MGLPEFDLLAEHPLSVVVFGPGYGESIVLRVATDGGHVWGVVDCARRQRRGESVNPAADLLAAHHARPSLVLLTHPHADHTAGMAAIIERALPGATIACIEPLLEAPSPFAALVDPDDRAAVSRSQTSQTHYAIRAAWRTGQRRWSLLHDSTYDLAGWTLKVLTPGANAITTALARFAAGQRVDLNELSAAVLIERGDTAVVLGADCAQGAWNEVAQWIAPEHLCHTRPVKVSHHGSRSAIHPVLIDTDQRDAPRPLIVTPFPSSGSLPRFDSEQGIELLLSSAGAVELTAMPAQLVPSTQSVTLDDARGAMGLEIFEGDQALQIRRPRPAPTNPLQTGVRDPYEAWVMLGIDTFGEIAISRGAHAVQITE